MGRPEIPINPADGPLQRFAHDLRELRKAAGSPSYRLLAGRANYSGTSLSEAARGVSLPSLDVTLSYVSACQGDVEYWERYWKRTAAELSADSAYEEPPQARIERTPRRHGRTAPATRPVAPAAASTRSGRPGRRPGTSYARMVSRAGSVLRKPETVFALMAGSWALATGLRVRRSAHGA
ncbi:hypothetical protein ACH4ZU_23010 [Streptomyces sp. NPDC020472]|uniref:hypothetical protein n=1 Tax=unclassified Streptomyces TaxID=2593676 RepID=UPI0036B4F278